MKLQEAINHARQQAEKQSNEGCWECSREHRQLADWLDELRLLKKEVVYKHYGQTFRLNESFLEYGSPKVVNSVNEYDHNEIAPNQLSDESTEESEVIELFAFKVDGDRDPFQSHRRNGEYYSLVCFSKETGEDVESWKDYQRAGMKRYLDKLDDIEDLKCIKYEYLAERDMPWKEYPYKIYICGCDDASYTKTFKTLEEAQIVINIIKEDALIDGYALVDQLGFIFTN